MKKACDVIDNKRHSELVSESQETLKQVQGDRVKAFTLAEIMIVLSVIAVLTAVLLPAARNATPNEDVMKFKKGHLALINTIQEMVNSDKYYLNGDLGVRPNNTLIDGNIEGTCDEDNIYFCETFADVLGNIKKKDCQDVKTASLGQLQVNYFNDESRLANQGWADSTCLGYQQNGFLPDIVTFNGISYYQGAPTIPFGAQIKVYQMQNFGELSRCETTYLGCDVRLFYTPTERNTLGVMELYKTFCMDIDGFNQGELPFGYGIRKDGKIFFGKRASEWFKKSIQNKD